MQQELVKCCPMLERYRLWQDKDDGVWFISLGGLDEGYVGYEIVGFCPYCGKELKIKGVE